MQRRLAKKLSDSLQVQGQEEEDYRHRHQFPIPQIPQQYAAAPPPPPPPQQGLPYGYLPQQSVPVDQPNPYYQQIPIRNPPSNTRLAATLNPQQRVPQPYYESLPTQTPIMPWNPPNYGPDTGSVSMSNSSDDLSDDVSLDEYIPEEPRGSYYVDDRDRDRDLDRDRDYRGRSSSVPPARISSRDRVRERDEPPIKLKGKKSSKSFLPLRKSSKSKSISHKDSDTYTSSGTSRSESGRTSRSHSSTSRPQSRSSSQISLSGGHRGQSSRKHSSTRVPGGHSPSRRGSSSSSSREVMALPIEIPESVTDADAFRRYLSVRRGGIDLAGVSATSSFLALDDDDRSESSMESVGLSSSSAPLAKTLNALGISIHRRTMALSQAIMTLALLSASASQLRFVVAYSSAQSYPALNYFLICTCIIVEILVGIGYVILSRFEFTDGFVEKVHSYLIFGLFVVAVANVIIASFALDDHVCEGATRKAEQYEAIDQPPPQNPP